MEISSEADVGSAKEAETFDVLNAVEFCLPCKEQDNEKQAEFWCTNCPELLCENCYGHHKVLKATRDHKMLSIIDYHMIGKSIAESESYCQVHPAKGIKFYCVTHNTPCCYICKEETHGIKCNVQLKDDILKITDIRGDLNAMIETMTKMVETMRTEILTDRWNVLDLEKQKTVFYDEMKNGRQLVENFLDKFENDEKEKFEIAFSAANETLCDNKRKIKHKLKTKQITIRDGFEAESVATVGQSHVGKKQPEFDDIEFSSSTVEAEEGNIVDENVQPERDISLDGVKLASDNILPC
ncbi:unnamed protein product [Mytilus edulis]|uniref:B box-type domain-containing protein n=1 Tax=Mytilus edulis TaxID=6550 RepID=A0A8S3T865_MYTED|nr:unnamed protein product [Mytilus edulis]